MGKSAVCAAVIYGEQEKERIGDKMKALILSISTGQGHHATGQAVSNCFESLGVVCETLDAYEYVEPLLKGLVSRGYLISTKYIPKVAAKAYDLVVKKSKPMPDYSVGKMTNTFMAQELLGYLDEYKPDMVVCTHVLSSAMMSVLKERGEWKGIVVGIVTDFTLHPLWEEALHIDYYVTPSELLEYQMRHKGMDIGKMLPFGIPIRSEFSYSTDRAEARRALGLSETKPTILLMSGSMGYGKIDKSLKKIDELAMDLQIMVVCGNNKKMYKKISRMQDSLQKDVRVYGYVDNVYLMMDAADCIITKPGGITSSEALAKGLPMIMVNPIPGHEQRNAEFMLNNGLALYATKSFPVDEAVFSLFRHPERVEDLRHTIALYGKKEAALTLCEFLMEKVRERTAEYFSEIAPDAAK